MLILEKINFFSPNKTHPKNRLQPPSRSQCGFMFKVRWLIINADGAGKWEISHSLHSLANTFKVHFSYKKKNPHKTLGNERQQPLRDGSNHPSLLSWRKFPDHSRDRGRSPGLDLSWESQQVMVARDQRACRGESCLDKVLCRSSLGPQIIFTLRTKSCVMLKTACRFFLSLHF